MFLETAHAVELVGVTRRFGEVVALDDVSLSVREGEFFCLLGPSGCGKTTLLRVIAGLEVADAGRIRIAGTEADRIPAHQRPVNTVFQSYALFPHLDVWQNIAFGLRMKKVPPAEILDRVRAAAALVQLDDLMRRRPSQLSGGQKQRVALARAIVNEPKVLLLDEPLAALDVQLRKGLQSELRSLQRRLGITFVYVTHDQEEALVLSDRIALMREGVIAQIGAGQELYERPKTRFASQFLGSCSLIDATVKQRDGYGMLVDTAIGELLVACSRPDKQRCTLAIRPEKIHLQATAPMQAQNVVRVRVEGVRYVGAETHYELRAGLQALRAEVMNTQNAPTGLRAGQDAFACLPSESLIPLDD